MTREVTPCLARRVEKASPHVPKHNLIRPRHVFPPRRNSPRPPPEVSTSQSNPTNLTLSLTRRHGLTRDETGLRPLQESEDQGKIIRLPHRMIRANWYQCDSAKPCSYCQLISSDCTYDLPQRRRGPKGPRTKAIRHAVHSIPSPGSDDTQSSPRPPTSDSITPDVTVFGFDELKRIHGGLMTRFRNEVLSVTIKEAVDRCISLYYERSFATLPICHEPTLRSDAVYFFSDNVTSRDPNCEAAGDTITRLRSFTLLTALCATMSFLHGQFMTPFAPVAGPLFLQAARDTLRIYEEHDLLHPDSSSMRIRMLLANCLQQYAGENGLSWHTVGQASLIARTLRLYSERELARDDPLESTLLRCTFWMLYMSDCAAICMRNRAVILHEPLLGSDMDLGEFGPNQVPLMDPLQPHCRNRFEKSILEGFHLLVRNWSLAARLMLAIRSYGRLATAQTSDDSLIRRAEEVKAAQAYVAFVSVLDTMPTWLQAPNNFVSGDDAAARHQRSCYMSQRYRLLSGHYCARLLAVHECRSVGLTAAIGLHDNDATIAVEQLNIARDFIYNLQSVPFDYLQTNGETGVSLCQLGHLPNSEEAIIIIGRHTGRVDARRRERPT